MERHEPLAAEPDAPAAPGAILVERDGAVASVIISRPAVRNALDTRMWAELEQVFERLEAEPDVRAVLLKGAGGTFSAGFDLQELSRLDLEAVERSLAVMERAIRRVESCPLPVVGVLRGVALGGACELILACDLRVASRTARLGVPVARLGLVPSPSFAWRLARLAGPSRARDVLMTARLVRAPEAMRWGLVNYLAADDEVEESARRLAARVGALAASAVQAGKRWCRWLEERPWGEEGRWAEAEVAHRFTASPEELLEGLRAWREHREPVFTGPSVGAGVEPVAGEGSARRRSTVDRFGPAGGQGSGAAGGTTGSCRSSP